MLRNGFRLFLELQYLVDANPPLQKRRCLSRCQFVTIDRTVRFTDLIKYFGERGGDVQVVIQSFEKFVRFCRRELVICRGVAGNILEASDPFVDSKQRLPGFAKSIEGEVQR